MFEVIKPIVDELLDDKDKDKNKQRGAAELIAGLIGGMLLVGQGYVAKLMLNHLNSFEALGYRCPERDLGLDRAAYQGRLRRQSQDGHYPHLAELPRGKTFLNHILSLRIITCIYPVHVLEPRSPPRSAPC